MVEAMKNNKTLYLFNLSLDLDNPVLATTNLWVNEFSKYFAQVEVYSTHTGRYFVNNNVDVHQLGGGSIFRRALAILRLTILIPRVVARPKNSIVLHHQSPRTSCFPGVIFRIAGVPQGLWYSHSSKPISLRIGARLVNKIYSSSPGSLPLKSEKAFFFGHGIDTNAALGAVKNSQGVREGVLFIGRISPIKRLEECIQALNESEYRQQVFTVIGPSYDDFTYQQKMETLAKELGVNVKFEKSISHDLVYERMANSHMFYAGMKNSVDKSCLEAAASGSLVITTDTSSAQLTGMNEVWKILNKNDSLPDLASQINIINSLNDEELDNLRKLVQETTSKLNSVAELTLKISRSMDF